MYHVVYITRVPPAFLPSFIIPVFSGDHLPALPYSRSPYIFLALSLCLSFYTVSSMCPFFRVTRGESFSLRPALRINVFNAIWMGVLWVSTTGNRLVPSARGENESVLMGERRALSWRSNGSRDDHGVRLCGCDYLYVCVRILAQVRSWMYTCVCLTRFHVVLLAVYCKDRCKIGENFHSFVHRYFAAILCWNDQYHSAIWRDRNI